MKNVIRIDETKADTYWLLSLVQISKALDPTFPIMQHLNLLPNMNFDFEVIKLTQFQ